MPKHENPLTRVVEYQEELKALWSNIKRFRECLISCPTYKYLFKGPMGNGFFLFGIAERFFTHKKCCTSVIFYLN